MFAAPVGELLTLDSNSATRDSNSAISVSRVAASLLDPNLLSPTEIKAVPAREVLRSADGEDPCF